MRAREEVAPGLGIWSMNDAGWTMAENWVMRLVRVNSKLVLSLGGLAKHLCDSPRFLFLATANINFRKDTNQTSSLNFARAMGSNFTPHSARKDSRLIPGPITFVIVRGCPTTISWRYHQHSLA